MTNARLHDRTRVFLVVVLACVASGLYGGLEALAATAVEEDKVADGTRRRFPEFFPPGVDHSIPLAEIFQGGPAKDGIPALTKPRTTRAAQAGYLDDDDVVLGVVRNGAARAYPLKIMNWHEIVNDVLGGEPIAVTYCPLCATGIAFDPHVNGRVTDFGVSGLLHNGDLLMYDRGTATPSLWQQALGAAVVGPATGTALKRIPITHARWVDWRRKNPATTVLSTDTGHNRNYDRDPYQGYAQDNRLFFAVKGARNDLPSKTMVFGLLVGDHARAYPIDRVRPKGVVNDRIGGASVVLIADEGDPGGMRAYERGEHQFFASGVSVTDETGAKWRVEEDVLVSEAGERLPRLSDGFVAFWFAWSAFYPQTDIYGDGTSLSPENLLHDQWGRVKSDNTPED